LKPLTDRVVPVPFGEFVAVEGAVFPTATSFPDDVTHGISAARLEKVKIKVKKSKSKHQYSIAIN
jgi:hypothetical protein